MDSDQRERRVLQKLQETEKTDRISVLPEDVLGQILSLLPTKYAVATSILSTRWRDLYKLTTNLDFDDSLSIHPEFRLDTANRSNCFRGFVDRVLDQCRSSSVTRFRLKCEEHIEYDVVTHWINGALSLYKFPHELELSVKLGVPFDLQLPELVRQNLKVLKLGCNFILRAPTSVRFPCLKVLFFKQVEFPENSLNRILFGSPSLEELVIIECGWNGFNPCFCNPGLKKLTLDVGISGDVLDHQVDGSRIHFNLPSLVYLKYNEKLPERYCIINLNSVVHAHLEVPFYTNEEACNIMLDIIKGVSNCEILYLTGECLEALATGHFELPVFQNLNRLKLCQGLNVGWNEVLLDFLNNSPRLESLTLTQGYFSGWNTDDDEIDSECLLGDHPVPSCVLSGLKIIKVKNFMGLRVETRMVLYFLEKANALEQMVIHCRQRNWERVEEILKFPKASETCSITLIYTNCLDSNVSTV